ncbi:hypothetical protein GGS21DRAFT_494062 [Xylaria nigripes]|nr:hypothetical protein GGS21DRAFT_494062 [Xylaria nigripes]
MTDLAEPSSSLLWTIIPPVSAVSLSIGIIAPMLSTYAIAYIAAPREIITFVEVVDGSVQENESYDSDVAKVSRLEDKMRLGRILQEIQKQGDDLREDLNRLVVTEGGTTLRTSARVLWAGHRRQLEERVRRLDLLRMRFLVIFLGIVATNTGERPKDVARIAPQDAEDVIPPAPPAPPASPGPRPSLNKEHPGNHQKPPRRMTTQAMGHSEKTEHIHRSGWFGVVAELQRSPILRQRHASIEAAMRTPTPLPPISTPLMTLGPVRAASVPETLTL